ncbi:glutamate-5-semialdehyde dehydrogenase [Candidatus Gottesmanbacteria bacterium]|nr:glutamate-5-semialdehyde dehydrogenase [Candidatus Gottesmanbacteria bacterium]
MTTQQVHCTREASIALAQTTESTRNRFLEHLMDCVGNKQRELLKANKKDIMHAAKAGLSAPMVARLRLDAQGIHTMIQRIEEVKKLDSGLGSIREEKITADGLRIRKVSVPLGVIFVIYEARPEVTIDVAALCIKSGNAAILKGGSEALQTNTVLYQCIEDALHRSALHPDTVRFVTKRSEVPYLLKQSGYIDLVIARGGYDLVKAVRSQSTIPVLSHAAGGARIYVDKSADLLMARKIIINAKVSKSAACNSLDTIVIHENIAAAFVPKITSALKASGVEIVEHDWDTEFLGLRVSIKTVQNVGKAVAFIRLHSKGHSEGIVAEDQKVIDFFVQSIDAAAVFVNCSTRLHDGYVFGLGSEMGISTGKLHARGPVGLKELTTYKWEVYGHGHIRE